MTLSIIAFTNMPLSMKTLSIMILKTMTLIITIEKHNPQLNNNQHNDSRYCSAKCLLCGVMGPDRVHLDSTLSDSVLL
jgi:hypothetical protein